MYTLIWNLNIERYKSQLINIGSRSLKNKNCRKEGLMNLQMKI